VVLFETYACGSERNYTGYCNADLEKLFHRQSMMTDVAAAPGTCVADRQGVCRRDGARPVIYHGQAGTCWQAHREGRRLAVTRSISHWAFEDVWLDR